MSFGSKHNTGPARLYSTSTSNATVQIVAGPRGVVLDIQGENWATDGRAARYHSTTTLALDEAVRIQTLLATAIDAAWDLDELSPRTDSRQTALWSPATYTAPVRRIA